MPARALVEVARNALLARAADAGVRIDLDVAGRVGDVALPAVTDAMPRVAVVGWEGPWLRPRVGVPVEIRAGEWRTAATVWFALSAPVVGEVYANGAARGEKSEALSYRTGQVDLARLRDRETAASGSLAGMRLRHAVRSGDPVQASDFEPVPMISARQMVRMSASRGAIRLSVAARALADGDAGETIPVLPVNATSQVLARVVSSREVALEN